MPVSQLEPRAGMPRAEPAVAALNDRDADLSLLSAVNVVLRRRGLVMSVTAFVLGCLVLATFLQPRSYTSSASFMPQARRAANGAGGGLAAQLGLSMITADASQSPSFYLDLLTSRGILDSTVMTRFRVTTDTGVVEGTLVDLLDAEGATPAMRRWEAKEKLRRLVRGDASPKTGVVTFSVRAEDPNLAQQISRRIIELVNRFNLQSRRTQASEERRFAERRLGEVAAELRVAEDALQSFLQRNRVYENSPELRFTQERLLREVAMRQQIYTSVAQAHEQARMDEVRDTPVITVVEQPNVPERPDSRGLLKRILIGLVVGLGLGVGLAFVREVRGRAHSEPGGEIEQFNTLWRDTIGDLTHPWRPVARAFRSRRTA